MYNYLILRSSVFLLRFQYQTERSADVLIRLRDQRRSVRKRVSETTARQTAIKNSPYSLSQARIVLKVNSIDVDEDEGVDTDLAPTESSRVSGRGSPTGTYNNTR